MNNIVVSGFIVNEPERGEGNRPDKFRMSVAKGRGDDRDSAIIGVSGWFDPDEFGKFRKGSMVVVAGALDWFTIAAKPGEKYDTTVFTVKAHEIGEATRSRGRDDDDRSSRGASSSRSTGRSSSRGSRSASPDLEESF